MSVPLRSRPHELTEAALRLAHAAGALAAVSGSAPCVVAEARPWRGAAALVQQAHVDRVGCTADRAAHALSRVAGALTTAASRCEEEFSTLRRLTEHRETLHRTQESLRTVALDAGDPADSASRAARLLAVAEDIRATEAMISAAHERLEQAELLAERVLRAELPTDPLDDLRALAEAAQGLGPLKTGTKMLWLGSQWFGLAARLTFGNDVPARVATLERMQQVARLLHRPPVWARALGRAGALALPVTVWLDAGPALFDGGGYAGWRGAATRVTAGVALPGAVALALPVPHAKAAGMVLAGPYYLLRGANALFDNRDTIVERATEVGALAWQEARRRATELADLLAAPGPLPFGVAVPVPHPEVLAWLVRQLPDPGLLSDVVRDLGNPFHIPDVPLGGGLRLPVLPSVPLLPPLLPPLPPVLPAIPVPGLPLLPGLLDLLDGPAR